MGELPDWTTDCIGRADLVTTARRRLRGARLLTVTGVAGVGKTTLALEVARSMRDEVADGAWWVDLAGVAEPGLVADAVAAALGIRDQSARESTDILIRHLRDRRALVVLDNCEHLVAAVARLVATLTHRAPGLRVLATSREVLGIGGEHVLDVPPLPVPEAEHAELTLERLGAVDSVRMLCSRAAAVAPRFALTAANRDAVANLVRAVDGLPLAIEVAAARLRALAVEEIVERLDRIFAVLTDAGRVVPSHHETLWAVVAWSHGLCSEDERTTWARASVFVDGFGLAAAEAVCSGGGIAADDIPRLLAALVDKSILIREEGPDGRTRFRLLETMRQFGAAQLRERGAEDAVRRRHLSHYRGLAAAAGGDWFGPREVEVLTGLGAELPNLRAAVHHAVEAGLVVEGVELAIGYVQARMPQFWGPIVESHHWLERLLRAPAPMPPPLRAAALAMDAWLLLCMGAAESAERVLTRTAGLPLVPGVRFVRGVELLLSHCDLGALDLLAQDHRIFEEAGEHGGAQMSLLFLSLCVSFLSRDRAEARRAARRCLEHARSREAVWAISWARWAVGLAELNHGNPRAALREYRAALRIQCGLDRDRWGAVWSLHGVAWAYAAIGDRVDGEHAAVLLGISEQLRERTGVDITGMVPFARTHALAERRASATLGEEGYRRAYRVGLSIPVDHDFHRPDGAWAMALGEAPTPAVKHGDEPPPFTRAEWQVIRLVGQGLPSKAVAARLGVTARTVDNHIQHIYGKLGWRGRGSRPLLVQWANEHREWVEGG